MWYYKISSELVEWHISQKLFSRPNFFLCRISFITLSDQTVHFVKYKRTPQQAKFRFFLESTTLLVFFDLLRCFGFHGKIVKTLLLKIAPKRIKFAESATKFVASATNFAASGIVCGIHGQIEIYVFGNLKLSWNPLLWVETANCKRNPHKLFAQ